MVNHKGLRMKDECDWDKKLEIDKWCEKREQDQNNYIKKTIKIGLTEKNKC